MGFRVYGLCWAPRGFDGTSDVCKRPLKEVARNRPHSRLQRDL